jgi:hypothetical protein
VDFSKKFVSIHDAPGFLIIERAIQRRMQPSSLLIVEFVTNDHELDLGAVGQIGRLIKLDATILDSGF